jgi:phosphoglycolate phosphatase-like HAD superfamily hydrolase
VNHVGLHTHYTPFFRVWEREFLDRVKRGELEYWQAFRMFLLSAGMSSGQVDQLEAAGHARRRELEEEVLPLPGVRQALARLQNLGIQLTLLSTSLLTRIEVYQRLARLGVNNAFQHVLSAPEIWRDSPETNAVSVAISESNIPPHQLAFVGRDSSALHHARAAGLRTVAVNYDDDAEANVFIEQFDQLLAVLPWEPAHSMVG